jgi:hypothetical protein
MRNALALSFVLVFLSACGTWVYQGTEPAPSDFFKGTDSAHWRQKYDLPERPF